MQLDTLLRSLGIESTMVSDSELVKVVRRLESKPLTDEDLESISKILGPLAELFFLQKLLYRNVQNKFLRNKPRFIRVYPNEQNDKIVARVELVYDGWVKTGTCQRKGLTREDLIREVYSLRQMGYPIGVM